MGYEEAPEGLEVGNGMYYNKWMAGNQIAMPAPILDGSVDYDDGTDTNAKQLSEDVVTFLKWSAEPELEVRKNMGIKVLSYFICPTYCDDSDHRGLNHFKQMYGSDAESIDILSIPAVARTMNQLFLRKK